MSRRAVEGVFIAGTDTGVGKTRTAVTVVRALVARGLGVAVMKPVAAGADATADGLRNDDALALMAAANVPAEYALVNPCCLRSAISPHLAAAEQGVTIDTAHIAQAFTELSRRADCVVVEGAGGWLTPIDDHHTMADLARLLHLPIVLVVGLRLGCLNHAQLTARTIDADGLHLGGWVANHLDPSFERMAENLATLERLLARRPLAFIGHDASDLAPSSIDALIALVRAT
jgi:dethiobiotin synthetase